jgi:hypothetical protein
MWAESDPTPEQIGEVADIHLAVAAINAAATSSAALAKRSIFVLAETGMELSFLSFC